MEIGYKSATLYFASIALLIVGGWLCIVSAKWHDDWVDCKHRGGTPIIKEHWKITVVAWIAVILLMVGFTVMAIAKKTIGE